MKALLRPGVAWVLMCALLAAGALGVAAVSDFAAVGAIGAIDAISSADSARTASAAAIAGIASAAAALDWQPTLAWSEPWRWWTAAWVHLSHGHLLANLAGCVVLAAFGWTAGTGWRLTLSWLVAWPLTHLALLGEPQLAHYGGLSGLLHAGVAIAAVGLVWIDSGRPRWIGAAVLVGLLVKVISERPWLGAVQQWPGWDIGIAPIAHATGMAAGLVCAVVACATAGSHGHGRGHGGPGPRHGRGRAHHGERGTMQR